MFPEKIIPLCQRGEPPLPVARGELSQRDRGSPPFPPSVRKIPGVQCRFLSSKCLLTPRLARDARRPACAPGMGARQPGARNGRLRRCLGGGRRRRPPPHPLGCFFPGLPPFYHSPLTEG